MDKLGKGPVLEGVAHDNSDYLVGDVAKTRVAGKM
jgi:hypothetical protein